MAVLAVLGILNNDYLQCRLAHLFDDMDAIQARMDAIVEGAVNVAGRDRLLTSVARHPKVRFVAAELACGYDGGWSHVYESNDPPVQVFVRFRQQFAGWHVRRQSEDDIELRNRENTASLTLTIVRPRNGMANDFGQGTLGDNATSSALSTIYEFSLKYGEPAVRQPG